MFVAIGDPVEILSGVLDNLPVKKVTYERDADPLQNVINISIENLCRRRGYFLSEIFLQLVISHEIDNGEPRTFYRIRKALSVAKMLQNWHPCTPFQGFVRESSQN